MNRQSLKRLFPSREYAPGGEPRVFGDRAYIVGRRQLVSGLTAGFGK